MNTDGQFYIEEKETKVKGYYCLLFVNGSANSMLLPEMDKELLVYCLTSDHPQP